MPAALAILSFVVSFMAVRVLVSPRGRFALDQPNERSLHAQPLPRTGGLAVLAGAAVSLAFGASALWLPLLLALALAIVSFLDDFHRMPVAARFVAHLAAAGVLVWYILSPMHPASLLLLLLAVAWVTNLYNFMDGSDGMAGGMAVIGFAAYAVAASLAGDSALAAVCTAIAAAAAAFLFHNFHPARIFLGDVGSIPLGFLAAALGIVGWRNDAWPLWFPLLAYGPFVGDATITLLKRLLRGDRVWRPHRDHYYQRLVRMGAGHGRTAVVAYVLMILCAGAALYGRDKAVPLQAAAFAGASAVLAMVAVWIDVRWARFLRTPPEPA